jgi:hypothetical protein
MTTPRGAPFDENNIFNRASVDGGKLGYEQAGNSLDGGSFTTPNTEINDCGKLPKVGTATYVPNPKFGPNGLIIGD